MYHILTLNNIAAAGIAEFDAQKYQVSLETAQPDAIIVRSFNLHQYAVPNSVAVIGRAGVGVNTIPIEKMTERGIPVLNTPGANANAVKELVITGMLLACRNICQAWDFARHLEGDDAQLTAHVEKNKKQFAGFELPGKTIAIIGLGSVGVKVANAAVDLDMKVIGYDPAITVRHAWELDSAVMQADSLEEAISHADFVSVHVPLNPHTEHLINAKRIATMKKGVILLNFARDRIVATEALFAALQTKQVRNYVCDFPNNLFQQHPQVICLPHLGASTKEAEENCAIMIAKHIQHYLEQGHIKYSVNFPDIKLPRTEGYRLAVINKNVPKMVAQISQVLSDANINIIDMINKSKGDIAYTLIDVNQKITMHLLKQLMAINGVIRARAI